MCSYMLNQSLFCGCLIYTVVTGKWLLSGVCAKVILIVSDVNSGIRAIGTLVHFVGGWGTASSCSTGTTLIINHLTGVLQSYL